MILLAKRQNDFNNNCATLNDDDNNNNNNSNDKYKLHLQFISQQLQQQLQELPKSKVSDQRTLLHHLSTELVLVFISI